MNSKRGSSTVFLVFIMSAVIGVTALFIYSAKEKAFTGIGEGILTLSMRSVMSEFNGELKDRYGIMAFEKSGMEAAMDIDDYIDYTFNNENPVRDISVTFGQHSIAVPDTLKKQIIEYMKTAETEGIFKDSAAADYERPDCADRTLRNQAIIGNLPSKPFSEDTGGFLDKVDSLADKLGSIEKIFDETAEAYLVDKYIIRHFKYATGGPLEESSFFDNEVEYILAGNYSNEKNRNEVGTAIKALRTGLNAAYIYSDEDKRMKTLAAAELLTPEAAAATQVVLVTTWAAAEADNDLKLLLKGKPVPLKKDDNSWATELDNVLENLTEECIDTGNEKGLYYSDYLMILLHFQQEDRKLARVADLIQINMKGTHDRDFLMKTANDGFHLKTKIYGKEHEYETCY